MVDALSLNQSVNVFGLGLNGISVTVGSATLAGTTDVNYSNNTVTGGSITLTPSVSGLLTPQNYSTFTLTPPAAAGGNYTLTSTSTDGTTTLNVRFPNNGDTATEPDTATVTTNVANVGGLGVGATLASGTGTITSTPVCFASGTLIRTAEGDRAVEDLRVGDLVQTGDGKLKPVKWLGHRTIDCRRHIQPETMWPVRIAAHAFGPDLPVRDLYLSAGHSVRVSIVEDVLIPVGKLVNGATIRRVPVDEVTYWHVELDSHDVILAENLLAESFLDCGNRVCLIEQEGEFDRAAGPHTPADFCLPYLNHGLVVDAVRARLSARAERVGWRLTQDMDLHLVVDGVRIDPNVLDGMARFVFPAGAREVLLASEHFVPSAMDDSLDHRRIGLSVHRFEVDDGLNERQIWGASHELFAGLFHPEEEVAGAFHRFTDGRTVLPSVLWAGCCGLAILRVGFDPASGQRWIAPAGASAQPEAAAVAAVPLSANVVSMTWLDQLNRPALAEKPFAAARAVDRKASAHM